MTCLFAQKFPRILEDIPKPLSGTEAKAREEFKGIVKILLFLASAEPVITSRRITPEVVKMVEKAGAQIIAVHGRTREQKRLAEYKCNW